MLDSKERKQVFYDLVIIGGGINGAAIARDAALRGLKVILLEKTDFGAGASTKTSKLAHGGLRYLEQFEFSLVKESLYERNLLLKNAPHLVHPLKFVYPVFRNSARPLWQVNLGLYLYDFFARNSGLPRHQKLTKEQIIKEFPKIQSENLVGGCTYYDAQMKDNRLVIENVLGAEESGATVLNYATVTNFIWNQGRIVGVCFRHSGMENDIVIKTNLVVNATGAWSNGIADLEPGAQHCRVAPTKGVHLVVPKMFDIGLILRAPQDGRIFFVLPWEKYSLIGATDTFFSDDPETMTINETDIEYLIEAFSYNFPHKSLNRFSMISTFAGLRPLVANHQIKKPSLVSRDYAIQLSDGGMITVLGGKFTTYRRIAEEVVNIVISRMDSSENFRCCTTEKKPLPGAISDTDHQLETELEMAGLKIVHINHLLQNYGQLARHILEIIKKNPLESEQICSEHPHIYAELTYAIMFEHVKQPDDWFYRRTSIAYSLCGGKKCLKNVVDKLSSIDVKEISIH